ncbi:hypothetical protein [Pseudomonas coronafaciens]|uniref:hypothetical protein n=1 Tax=Pseudomonas coronafaciens TaxID=53409 RepID=UPI0032DCDCFE
MSYLKIKTDDVAIAKLAKLAKESSTAYVLLMYIAMGAETTRTKYFMAYLSRQEMAEYLGKSLECVRKCLILLRSMDLIEFDVIEKGKDILSVELKINRYK